jgi:hypothetical protein
MEALRETKEDNRIFNLQLEFEMAAYRMLCRYANPLVYNFSTIIRDPEFLYVYNQKISKITMILGHINF